MHQCAQKTMKLICSQKKLNNGLNIVEKAIGKSLPVLECVLVSAKEDKIELSTTNLEISIKHQLSAQVEEEGQIVVPAKLFSDFVEKLPNKDIELNVQKNALEVKCGEFKAKINGLDVNDFPVIPEIKSESPTEIKQNILKETLSRVIEMASTSESRPEISGVFINPIDKSTKIVATDSFRLAEKNIETKFEQAIILPRQTVQELIKILDNDGEKAKIFIDDNQILFDLGETKIKSRLIEGPYPDYQKIIPQDFETKITIDRQELIDNLVVSSIFANKINEIKLIIDPQESQIKIISHSEKGKNESCIKAEIESKVEGELIEILFNYKYILDGLNNMFSDKIILNIAENAHKTIINPVGDNSYIYLIMPLAKSDSE